MLIVKLDTGFNIEVEFAISPFHKRFFAWLIDFILQVLYLWFAPMLLNELLGRGWGDEPWAIVLFLLPYACYHLVCELSMNGQSIGKLLMGIKVMTLQGGEPSRSQYLIRWLFRVLDFPVIYILLIVNGQITLETFWIVPLAFAGLVSVIFTPKSQRIGDLVAGTILIDLKNHTSWEDTVFTELEADYQPRYPQVMQLSDKDINTLKSIIDSIKRKNDYELSFRIAERIKSKLHLESDQDALEFLQTLLKDYNYYSTN
jgi:uncharacterized RDD family membrane protein YckC